MERLTKLKPAGSSYYIEATQMMQLSDGYTGEAVDRLACFENMYDTLLNEQTVIPAELDKLRLEGKTKTVKFKELLTQKLLNEALLARINRFGIR